MQEIQEGPLEKEMATRASILAWEIPWTEELVQLQSMGLQRVRHDWGTKHALICSPCNLLPSVCLWSGPDPVGTIPRCLRAFAWCILKQSPGTQLLIDFGWAGYFLLKSTPLQVLVTPKSDGIYFAWKSAFWTDAVGAVGWMVFPPSKFMLKSYLQSFKLGLYLEIGSFQWWLSQNKVIRVGPCLIWLVSL